MRKCSVLKRDQIGPDDVQDCCCSRLVQIRQINYLYHLHVRLSTSGNHMRPFVSSHSYTAKQALAKSVAERQRDCLSLKP